MKDKKCDQLINDVIISNNITFFIEFRLVPSN